MKFLHDNLLVYQKALGFFDTIQQPLASWDRRHAFVDHLSRASESILFNLAEAARLRSAKKKALSLDYSTGSVFECAACLDIATLKDLATKEDTKGLKHALLEVARMLFGLRKSWAPDRVQENQATYTAGDGRAGGHVFYHETLDRYKVALDFYRWLATTPPGSKLGAKFERFVDTLATSVVLNIAESNGRYSELSTDNFLNIANAAATKLAVALDMGIRRGLWPADEASEGKCLLVRVGQMTATKKYQK